MDIANDSGRLRDSDLPDETGRCGVFLLWEVKSYGDALPELG